MCVNTMVLVFKYQYKYQQPIAKKEYKYQYQNYPVFGIRVFNREVINTNTCTIHGIGIITIPIPLSYKDVTSVR